MTFLEAAETVLREANTPLRPEEITERALADGRLTTDGLTPAATMAAQLAMSLKQRGAASPFVRTAPNTFGLREWVETGRVQPLSVTSTERRVRVPHYPIQAWVRAALPLLAGVTASTVTRMEGSIARQRGNPQANKDWSDPNAWIDETLEGDVADLAHRLWDETRGLVNPRHLRGTWLFCRHYELIDETAAGKLILTDRGRDFLAEPSGSTARDIDDREGLLELLSLVSERGQARKGDLIEPWRAYLSEVSNFSSDSSTSMALWERLRNLLERGYVSRSGTTYAITPEGLAWLGGGSEPAQGGDTHQQIVTLAQLQRQETRETLHELLREMDPYAFESVVARLLESMGYNSPEVTPRGGDGGVDVVATFEMGITTITEVIQVKRVRSNINRPILDALRGSLHRFKADRGTIITTSSFSPGTIQASREVGAAPITLIDGSKLLDLMIEHGIGIRKKGVELWEVDEEALSLSEDPPS